MSLKNQRLTCHAMGRIWQKVVMANLAVIAMQFVWFGGGQL